MALKKELSARYDRSIKLFGAEGQRKLRQISVAVVGIGGLGSAMVQQLALLGVGSIELIDSEDLDETNRNRFIGARSDDPVPGSLKVNLGHRLVQEVNPEVISNAIPRQLISPQAFTAIKDASWVIGCFDEDGPRAVLNELCAAYAKPYIDLASDVPEPGVYGGRVCVAYDGNGCLSCFDLLDRKAVRRYIQPEEEIVEEDKIYGVDRGALDEKGPSVAPLNSVVASLAAMEFMVAVTGMRAPTRLQEYRGNLSKVLVITDPPKPNCFICGSVWGCGEAAEVERYLALPKFLGDRPT
ncbi:MAG TPA: ThiF family adenylyltransferase [Burkholderiales bacterium]|nr:ThiF family adenylyltransferase [Burkholderiales bacterium]